MKRILAITIIQLATVPTFAQNTPGADKSSAVEPIREIILTILFISFLIFMLTTLVKYFLDYRLKSKLVDRGMSEQLTAHLSGSNDQDKQKEVIKLAILFCGIGLGLTITYLTAPIHIHSLAIMVFSLGLSYLAYFFYLRKSNK